MRYCDENDFLHDRFPESFESFVIEMIDAKTSFTEVNHFLVAAGKFLSALGLDSAVYEDLLSTWRQRARKARPPQPKYKRVMDLRLFFSALAKRPLPKQQTMKELRQGVAFLLMADCGGRQEGLEGLFANQMKMVEGCLHVRFFRPKEDTDYGDFTEWRIIAPFPQIPQICTVTMVQEYCQRIGTFHSDKIVKVGDKDEEKKVAPFFRALKAPFKSIVKATVHQDLKKLFQDLNVDTSFSVHHIRHMALSTAIKVGMSLDAVSKHAHVTKDTIQRYYRLNFVLSGALQFPIPTSNAQFSDYLRAYFSPDSSYIDHGIVLDEADAAWMFPEEDDGDVGSVSDVVQVATRANRELSEC